MEDCADGCDGPPSLKRTVEMVLPQERDDDAFSLHVEDRMVSARCGGISGPEFCRGSRQRPGGDGRSGKAGAGDCRAAGWKAGGPMGGCGGNWRASGRIRPSEIARTCALA